jgi:hypothetical protein
MTFMIKKLICYQAVVFALMALPNAANAADPTSMHCIFSPQNNGSPRDEQDIPVKTQDADFNGKALLNATYSKTLTLNGRQYTANVDASFSENDFANVGMSVSLTADGYKSLSKGGNTGFAAIQHPNTSGAAVDAGMSVLCYFGSGPWQQ